MENNLRNLRLDLEMFERISNVLDVTRYINSPTIKEFLSSRSKDIFYRDILDMEDIIRLFKKFFKDFFNKDGHVMLPMPSKSPLQTADDMQEYYQLLGHIYFELEDSRELSSLEKKRFDEAVEEAVQLSNLESSIEDTEMDCYDYCMHSSENETSFADSPKKTAKSKGFIPKNRHLKRATKLKLDSKKVWKSSRKERSTSLKKEVDRKNSEWLGGLSIECV